MSALYDFDEAKRIFLSSDYTCVAVRKGQQLTSTERGVKPLLTWFDAGVDLSGFCVADKVIGNGAAMLYVLLKAKMIYTPVLSEAARETLEKHEIKVRFDMCVPEIRNRRNTGSCPMELVVRGISEPEQALQAIRKKLMELQDNQINGK